MLIQDIKRYLRCPQLYLYAKETPIEKIPYLNIQEGLNEWIAKKIKATSSVFLGNENNTTEEVIHAMRKYNWLQDCWFEYQELKVNVPFMKKTKMGWTIYFISKSNFPKANELNNWRYVIEVLRRNKVQIDEVLAVHFNKDYVRQDYLDFEKVFKVSSFFYNSKGKDPKMIKNALLERRIHLDPLLRKIKKYRNKSPLKRELKCFKKGKCNFYNDCFPDEINAPNDSTLTLVGGKEKYELYDQGILRLHEIQLKDVEGNRLQYAQVNASKKDGLHFDSVGVKGWLDQVEYPLTFLDFEWETFLLPPYKGMKPFEIMPFQYSLHVLTKDGTLSHFEFLGEGNCREELLQSLLKNCPEKGSIISFNADAAEKLRIKELGKQFPKVKKRLMKIQRRMMDLSFPFTMGMVYDVRQRGNYSLKALMRFMDHSGYESLDIQQGMDAVLQWRAFENERNPLEKDKIRKQLLAYCEMDTYSMVVIYRWLQEKLENELKNFKK